MKTSQIKSFYFSFLAVLFIALIFSSCEQSIENLPQEEVISTEIQKEQSKEELEQLENKIQQTAVFAKTLEIMDPETRATATITIQSNKNDLLASYDEENLTLGELEETDRLGERDEMLDMEPNTEESMDLSKDVVSITVENVYFPEGSDEEQFTLKFSENLRNSLKEKDVVTLINVENIMNSNRVCGWARSIRIRSDGYWDGRKLSIRVYYENGCSYYGSRYGSLYNCLTSKVTNWGVSCYSGLRIYRVTYWNDAMTGLTFYASCGASC